MILIIDNYDSFVYNLAQYIGELNQEPVVARNDEIIPEEIERLNPSHIIVSPGPCTPREAGISNEVIRRFAGRIPILGVCLGHQCIGYVFGCSIVHAVLPTHGKSSFIYHDGRTIYENLPNPLRGGRYHSLVIEPDSLTEAVCKTASTEDGTVMGIRHKKYVVEGVQFHPESIMTESGRGVISNFLKLSRAAWSLE